MYCVLNNAVKQTIKLRTLEEQEPGPVGFGLVTGPCVSYHELSLQASWPCTKRVVGVF